MSKQQPLQIVVNDCSCPICGAPEIANRSDPVDQWRLNVRAFKTTDGRGLCWSECLPCKATDGNGWFAIDDDGNVVVEPARIAALEAQGEQVERIAA